MLPMHTQFIYIAYMHMGMVQLTYMVVLTTKGRTVELLTTNESHQEIGFPLH
jgi:hypothetical protein